MNMSFLIFSRYSNDAINHHSANAHESPINIFAGWMLNTKNANNPQITIPRTVVERYHQYVKVITARTASTIIDIHQARPSSQSVIFIAFTIPIVMKNVIIGYQIPRCTGSLNNGQRLR